MNRELRLGSRVMVEVVFVGGTHHCPAVIFFTVTTPKGRRQRPSSGDTQGWGYFQAAAEQLSATGQCSIVPRHEDSADVYRTHSKPHTGCHPLAVRAASKTAALRGVQSFFIK